MGQGFFICRLSVLVYLFAIAVGGKERVVEWSADDLQRLERVAEATKGDLLIGYGSEADNEGVLSLLEQVSLGKFGSVPYDLRSL